MKYTQGEYRILSKKIVAKNMVDMVIECPDAAKVSEPGQFVHILPNPSYTLRRPISIGGIDKQKGTIRIIFEIRGKGTEDIAKLNEGQNIDMMAPLGHGFKLLPNARKVIVVGGGIGTPPMLPIAEFYGEKAVAISGFRNASAVILQDDFKKSKAKTIVCTDDGSCGTHGLVTIPLGAEINSEKPDIIYACGPKLMLRAVAEMAEKHGIECQVSLEERMGCGVGACLVCACKTRDKNGEEQQSHVCKNGPVFNSKEVIW